MKFIKEWLRPSPAWESSADDETLPSAGDALEEGPESLDATPDLASSGWLGKGSVDSSIFDSTRWTAKKQDDRDHTPQEEEQASGHDALSSAEKDKGYDPYDTGRFYVQKTASEQ